MRRPVIAVYDANILYPAPLRDLFIRLAHAGLVRARWTDAIHEEWIQNVLKNNPGLTAERLARTRLLMDSAIRDCLIDGYDSLIETLTLPDPDDRHVLAAAIHARADVIVTFNLKDFPDHLLSTFGISAQHPDDFLCELLDNAPAVVCAALKQQRESLRNPSMSIGDLLDALERQNLAKSVGRLRQFSDLL